MPRRLHNTFHACWAVILAAALFPAGAQSTHDKSVTNFDGGIFLDTDGIVPGGACLRVKGRVDAPEFFVNLRREDTRSGTLYRRGNDVVTHFPDQLQLRLVIQDCDQTVKRDGVRVYLTDEMIRSLRLSFFWKSGVQMRPARGVAAGRLEVSPVATYYQGPDPPPQRYEWLIDFDVPSEGVPLTDSLVLVLRTPDHRVVARTAARL